MKDVTVIGRSATLASGALRLSAKQAAARASRLRAIKGDVYEIIAPVEFKLGETFGYDAEISKAMALVLDGGHRPPSGGKRTRRHASTTSGPGASKVSADDLPASNATAAGA